MVKRVVKLTGITCSLSGQVTVNLRPYAHPTSGSGKNFFIYFRIITLELVSEKRNN
jgi:hypothetical protein